MRLADGQQFHGLVQGAPSYKLLDGLVPIRWFDAQLTVADAFEHLTTMTTAQWLLWPWAKRVFYDDADMDFRWLKCSDAYIVWFPKTGQVVETNTIDDEGFMDMVFEKCR